MSESRVAFLPANPDGCALWRMWTPHLRTAGSRYFSQHPVPFRSLVGSNVVVVQRLASHENYTSLLKFKEIGLGIVYDLDDDMWSVASSNPAAAVMRSLKGQLAGFDECSKLADVITVSTGKLESSVKTNMKHGVPIRVVNNAVDLAALRPSPIAHNPERAIVGWGGSATHSEDLRELGDSLLSLLQLEQHAYLHFVGMLPDKRYIGNKKVLAHGWLPVQEYFTRLSSWNWDVYLAPLTDSRFNRSKSCIKAVEAGAMQIPCLMSDVQPFREFTCHDSELAWLLCRRPQDWLDKCRTLVNDVALRTHYGMRCYDVVHEHYNMETKSAVWRNVYDSVVKG